MSLGGTMAMMVAPVAIARVSKVEVPCCASHENGVALYRQGGGGTIIAFRSYSFFRQFCDLNGVGPSGTVGGYPVGDHGRAASAKALARNV
jgi:hypothetical protein